MAIVVFLCAGAVAVTPAFASPSVVYVAADGSDGSSTCATPASPCGSITYALTQVSDGGTIYVSGTIDVFDSADDPGDANGVEVNQDVTIAQARVGRRRCSRGRGRPLPATAS